MLRRNNEIHTLNTCKLNEDFTIDEHKFVNQNGRLFLWSKKKNDAANNHVSYAELQNWNSENKKIKRNVKNRNNYYKQIQIFIAKNHIWTLYFCINFEYII